MFRVKFEGICIVVRKRQEWIFEKEFKNFGIGVKTETK